MLGLPNQLWRSLIWVCGAAQRFQLLFLVAQSLGLSLASLPGVKGGKDSAVNWVALCLLRWEGSQLQTGTCVLIHLGEWGWVWSKSAHAFIGFLLQCPWRQGTAEAGDRLGCTHSGASPSQCPWRQRMACGNRVYSGSPSLCITQQWYLLPKADHASSRSISGCRVPHICPQFVPEQLSSSFPLSFQAISTQPTVISLGLLS